MLKTKKALYAGLLVLISTSTSRSMDSVPDASSAADPDAIALYMSTKAQLDEICTGAHVYLQSFVDSEPRVSEENPFPQLIKQLHEKTCALQRSIRILDDQVGYAAQSYALSDQCAKLRALLAHANKHSTTALSYLAICKRQDKTFQVAALMSFKVEVQTADIFVERFFSILAHIDTHIASTRGSLRPVQEALDGLLHQAQDTAECADLPAVHHLDIDPTIIPGITHTALTRWQKMREKQFERTDPFELLADDHAEPAEPVDSDFSLPKIISWVQKARGVCASQARPGSFTDRALGFVSRACERVQAQVPKVQVFLEQHRGENLATPQNIRALEFLVDPSTGPATLCIAQRVPTFALRPLFWLQGTSAEEQESITNALKRNGFQPSDLARLSEKFCSEFGYTQEDRDAIKQKFPEWLEKASEFLEPECVDTINRAITRAPQLAKEAVAGIRSFFAQQEYVDSIAHETTGILQKLVDHHEQVLREESDEIARLKRLGEHAQEIQKRS